MSKSIRKAAPKATHHSARKPKPQPEPITVVEPVTAQPYRDAPSGIAVTGMEGLEKTAALFDVLKDLCEAAVELRGVRNILKASTVLGVARLGSYLAMDAHNTLDCIREDELGFENAQRAQRVVEERA